MRVLANIGLSGDYDVGVDDWGAEMNLNLLKLSVMVQGGAAGVLAAEPVGPAEGTVVILNAAHATHANAVAVFDEGAWVYFTPLEGWWFYDRVANNYVSFDGAAWGPFVGGGGGGGVEEAPEDGTPYARQDAGWVAVASGADLGEQSHLDFAAVTFESDGTILSGHNVASVEHVATGRYLVTFETPAEDAEKILPSGVAWFGPFANSDALYVSVCRNPDRLAGAGVTAEAVYIITKHNNSNADADGIRVALRFGYVGRQVTVGTGLYRFGSFFSATPAASEVVLMHVATDAFTLPVNLAGSVFYVTTPPVADAVFKLTHNGVDVGTVTFHTATAPTLVMADSLEVAVGDVLTLVAPLVADGTIANVAYTFRGAGPVSTGGGSGKPWYWNPPKIADFAADSYGTTTEWADDSDVGLIVASTNVMSIVNVKGAALPAGVDWTCTMHFAGALDNANYANMGITFYNAAHSKFFLWTLDSRSSIHFFRYNGGAFDGYETLIGLASAPDWLRVGYNQASGVASLYYSGNGKVWTLALTRNVKGDLGGDPVFIGPATNGESGHTQTIAMAVDHWEVV